MTKNSCCCNGKESTISCTCLYLHVCTLHILCMKESTNLFGCVLRDPTVKAVILLMVAIRKTIQSGHTQLMLIFIQNLNSIRFHCSPCVCLSRKRSLQSINGLEITSAIAFVKQLCADQLTIALHRQLDSENHQPHVHTSTAVFFSPFSSQ